MKQRFDKSAGGLVFVGLPLLLVAGCATDKANLAQIDPHTPQVEGQVNSQSDQAALSAMGSTASPAEQTSAQAAPDEAVNESAAQAQQDTETIASPEAQAAAPTAQLPSVFTETDVSVSSGAQASTPAGETVVAASDEPAPSKEATVTLPQQMIFYFGFNQDEISAADRRIVKQHAEYLLAHPEYTLLITGHADNRGPRAYNQRLSEARARKVEQILEADGVPKQQLRISAMGASSPMVDPDNYRQNRRVEFTYQDAVVAKGQ